MSKKKITIAAIVLALVLLIGGLIAFFTDTDEKSNVFTLGNVDITLTEPSWVATNGENMSPGKEVNKDPTVNNVGSTPAYVFVEVKVPMTNETTPKEVFTYTTNSGWVEVGTAQTSGGYTTHVYAYGSASAMTELAAGTTSSPTPTSTPVFSKVKLNPAITDPSTITLTNNEFKLDIKAKAIQSNDLGATTPAAVYALF